MHKSVPIHKNKAVTDCQKIYNHRSVFETVACMLLMCCRSVGKHSSLGGHRSLTGLICLAKINSYGEGIKSGGGHGPPGSYAYVLYASYKAATILLHACHLLVLIAAMHSMDSLCAWLDRLTMNVIYKNYRVIIST